MQTVSVQNDMRRGNFLVSRSYPLVYTPLLATPGRVRELVKKIEWMGLGLLGFFL